MFNFQYFVFILLFIVFRHRLRKILTLISEGLAGLALLILYLENVHAKAIIASQGIFATIFTFNMTLCLVMGACLMCSWNKEIDLDEAVAKNDDEAKAMEAGAAEGGNLTAVVPTPFGMLAPNTAVNNTDRALAADGPSIEENKKEDDDINWAIEDAKKASSDPKETGGTSDKQN